MLAAATTALAQTPAPVAETTRPGALSVVVTPQELRPVEKSDRSNAAARDQVAEKTARNANNDTSDEEAKLQLPLRAPDDPAQDRRGRNMNMVFDQKSGRTIIEIINPRTGEVMDRIPPENLLERAQKDGLATRANLVDQTA